MSIKNTQKIHKNFPLRRTEVILDFIEVIIDGLYKNNVRQYVDNFILIKFLIVFLIPKYFSED